MSNQIMKGMKMKEKIILSMSILCILGIIWISKANQKNDTDLTIMNQMQPSSIENFTPEHVDDIIPETNEGDKVTAETKTLDDSECSLTTNETDSFAFGDAFKHYRQCLGNSEKFNWKGHAYTTQLEKEKIIQMADSAHVKEAKNVQEISETQ